MAILTTQEMELNMGPHHPSTHGVLRFILKTDGEVVSECKPDVGYLHRSIEKIGELVGYLHVKDVLYADAVTRFQPVPDWRVRRASLRHYHPRTS